MGEIIAGIIVFNEERMLAGCLESLQGKVDRCVVVDGAYLRYPHEVPWSTDRTREIVDCYGADWVGCRLNEDEERRAWWDQIEKRNAYLVGEEGDWYLYIDADERLIGELPELVDGQVYDIRVWSRGHRLAWANSRLFQHRGRMRYEGAHYAIWSDDVLLNSQPKVRIPPVQCHLAHLTHLRLPEEQRAKQQWLPKQRRRERAYRAKHGLW